MAPNTDDFIRCCGDTQFATLLAERGPFYSLDQVIQATRAVWWNEVPVPGWLEAFAAHPRIGDVEALKTKFSNGLEAGEQSAALATANEKILKDLADWNSRYERKFGHIFVIYARGKSSQEILTSLKKRYSNKPVIEIRVAGEELLKITESRWASLDIWSEHQRSKGSVTPGPNEKEGAGSALRPPITTHVLDVSLGKPGEGIDVKLERFVGGEDWALVGSSLTNSDGRCGQLMERSNEVAPGKYRLTFDTGKYFMSSQGAGKSIFYPHVQIVFEVLPNQVFEHFHVPLLLSPYSYTTYRGS